MEENTDINETIVLHIRVKRLLYEILKDKGDPLDKSPHQVAGELLKEKMYQEGMMPKKKPADLVAELIYGVVKGIQTINENGEKIAI